MQVSNRLNLEPIVFEINKEEIPEIVDEAIKIEKYDWYQQASNVYQKKYGHKPVTDYNDKLKRSRFLQQRGFTADQIQNVIE